MEAILRLIAPAIQPVLDWVNGRKTYLGAAGFALLGVVALANGDYSQAATYLSLAMTAVGLRHAISKV